MKIEDIIDKMSKSYLDRIVKSFTNEIYTKDEEGYRKKIKERLNIFLKSSKNPYQNGLLINFILRTLLRCSNYQAKQEEIIESIKKSEQEVIKNSKSSDSFKHIDD